MRAVIDTNVLFSVLLASSRPASTIGEIVNAAIRGEYEMLVPEEVIDELDDVWRRKKADHPAITDEQMQRFIRLMRDVATLVPASSGPIPHVLRDRKDDFLLMAVVWGDADVLVTGDRDMLDIRGELARPVVLTPAEFLTHLKSMSGK